MGDFGRGVIVGGLGFVGISCATHRLFATDPFDLGRLAVLLAVGTLIVDGWLLTQWARQREDRADG